MLGWKLFRLFCVPRGRCLLSFFLPLLHLVGNHTTSIHGFCLLLPSIRRLPFSDYANVNVSIKMKIQLSVKTMAIGIGIGIGVTVSGNSICNTQKSLWKTWTLNIMRFLVRTCKGPEMRWENINAIHRRHLKQKIKVSYIRGRIRVTVK